MQVQQSGLIPDDQGYPCSGAGRPASVDSAILPALEHWAIGSADKAERTARQERLSITFGACDAPWDMERVLERYEVLYEAGLVEEAVRDRALNLTNTNDTELRRTARAATGRLAALDHRRMMATALGRIRGKLQYRPVVFELLPATFTLLHLQQVAESLAGISLHKQNFRRLVTNNRLVEPTGKQDRTSPGRPAELFRFRRDVLYERPAPGVGITARGNG